MKKTAIRKYARLIARVGGGVRKGNSVVILSSLELPEFTTMVAEECYKAGASKVEIRWTHGPAAALDFKYQTKTQLKKVSPWLVARAEEQAEELPVRISLRSVKPSTVTTHGDKRAVRGKALSAATAKANEARRGKDQWTVVAMPNPEWAKKVFPGLRTSAAMDKLWQAIFDGCRITDTEDPEVTWQKHMDNLESKCQWLNSLQLDSVHLYAKNGTDITMGMIPEARFITCRQEKPKGMCVADLPSEECYISPDYRTTNGIVYGELPMCLTSGIIDNYWLKFENGKVVDFGAETGENLLKHLIETDENSCYLGEVALVAKESPIRQSGILFYDTLFDENAACHLALGKGFPECLVDFMKYSPAELRELGINNSRLHHDFMIGTDDFNVDGITKDGKVIPIFRNGTWA